MRKWIGLGLVAMFLAGTTALAQDKVQYKKKTIIDLSGAIIEGELVKPEGSYIVNRKLSRFSDLITVRQSYKVELLHSHNEL